jgi:sialic acid synthase SpsE
MNIGGVEIGGSNPCRTVAEVSNNHNGSFEQCTELIRAAKLAGADFVKFQCYTPDELVLLRGDGPAPAQWGEQGWSMHDLYTEAQTPLDWFRELAVWCKAAGIPWFASAFGKESVALMQDLGCPVFKMASLDYGNEYLRGMVRATLRPIIQSCNDDHWPFSTSASEQLYLYCPPGYPQTRFDLKRITDTYHGFSYHGVNPLVPAMSVMAGAKLVEVHMQLEDKPSKLEQNISLTEHQFADMVTMIREVEAVR